MQKMNFTHLKALEKKYGLYASWALWSPQASTPKSGIGDLSIFTGDFSQLITTKFVLVGLNVSRGAITRPWANFHDERSEATDYKIRHAVEGTPLWGSYMTDVLKDCDEKDSVKVLQYARSNPKFVSKNIELFMAELKDLTDEPPVLFAFGNTAAQLLRKHVGGSHRIIKVPHYAAYMSKELYREKVCQQISLLTG